MWTCEPHGALATRHQRQDGEILLTVIAYARGVIWYAGRYRVYGRVCEGRAATLEAGQWAAETAGRELAAETERANGVR